MTEHSRRGLLTGLGTLFLCAPAIVRAASLDAIRGVPMGLPANERIVAFIDAWRLRVEGGLVRWEWVTLVIDGDQR